MKTIALPPEALQEAIAEADLRVLLMVVFQLSGDRRWLAEPFRPKRDVNLIAANDAGLSEAAQAEVRAAAVDLLSHTPREAAISNPDEALTLEMMRWCLGENIAAEYAPMMREEMGFEDRHVAWSGAAVTPQTIDARPVIIVGAGASGIALGANLVKLNIPFIIVEKNADVGGTWFENTYPGCGVDTPNHAYSFSFGKRHDWSRYFAPQPEIHAYLAARADEFGLKPHIRFQHSVTAAHWSEDKACWQVSVTSLQGRHETIEARALVSAIGQLSLPSIPSIPGQEKFQGRLFHSSNWPEDLDLTGKRLALIGTGASAMQIVPTVAGQVSNLTIFQRSAQWARPIPRYHDPIGPLGQWLLQSVPFYAAWFRFTMLWRYGDGLLPSLRKDPDWAFPERALNRANDRHRQQMTAHIHQQLEGRPDLIAKCLPSYPPYGKRILLDNGWYTAIRQNHVHLETTDITEITTTGITTADGRQHGADIIVLATGFKVALMAARLNITGRKGENLADRWANDNPTAYLGITVPGFPNLFCMQGPNTGLGHGGSAIFQAECQARYIAAALVAMTESGIAALDVDQDAHDRYVASVDHEHEQLIWTHPGMSTYYRNGQGRVVSVMPWRLVDYWEMTQRPDLSDYQLTPLAPGGDLGGDPGGDPAKAAS